MKYHVEFDIDLKRNPYKGVYICLEGIDGSGKTTQALRLAEYLKGQGKSVVATREPQKEGLIGDILQKILTGKIRISSLGLQYLFSADRVLHQKEVIIPALKSGKVVISDRCFWSAIIYGILDREGWNDPNAAHFLLTAHSVLSMYHQFIVPDYTFYLNVSLETAFLRISKKNDKLEIYDNEDKLQKLIKGYEWLAKKFKNEITIIDGNKSVGKVTKEMINKISNF